jgi:hypothetical protein
VREESPIRGDDPRGDGGRPKTPTNPKSIAIHVDRSWHFFWKRRYPGQFSDARKLARAVATADRGVDERGAA